MKNISRIHQLDYLRGLAALGIMIFHYSSWAFGRFSAEDVIERIGIYGVSIFYVLSGLTLFHVYHDKMYINIQNLKHFYIKRIFRIYPLLWIASMVSILLAGQKPEMQKLILNFTGLFGFVSWNKTFATGAWSIGNELTFYVLFPVLIYGYKKQKSLLYALLLASFAIYLWFAFFKLNELQTLSEQGSIYTNPLNQCFLFISGFFIGALLKHTEIKNGVSWVLISTGALLFMVIPAQGDSIVLVVGINRILFTLCCLLVCVGIYRSHFKTPMYLNKSLSVLGEISYSVYMLHPIIYILVKRTLFHFPFQTPLVIRVIVAIIATLICSYLVYRYFERWFIERSNLLTNKLSD